MSVGRSLELILGICFWGLIIGLYLEGRRKSGKEAEERNALDDRLIHPDWEFYEGHLGRPAPPALRELFANRALVTSCGLNYDKDNGISSFRPLDKDALLEVAGLIGHDIVPIATSDCGDAIYLRPGAGEPETVYIAYHDEPGRVETFAESVTVMLERLKKENRLDKG